MIGYRGDNPRRIRVRSVYLNGRPHVVIHSRFAGRENIRTYVVQSDIRYGEDKPIPTRLYEWKHGLTVW